MAVVQNIGRDYRLGSRVPLTLRSIADEATRIARDVPSRVIERATATTSACDKADSNLCEKPDGGASMTLPIVLGVVIPLTAVVFVLFYLHRRNVKQVRNEDIMDPHKSLDFGLAMDAKKAKAKRKSSFFGGEKDMFSNKSRQLSMDMNLSSPYLLPPELQNSRESLHSLARTLHQNEDPYRPVHSQYGSDAGSLRSFRKDNASIYTKASADPLSRGPSRNNRMSMGPPSPMSLHSKSTLPPPYPAESLNASMPSSPAAVKQSPFSLDPSEIIGDEKPYFSSPAEADGHAVAELQAPEPTASKISRKGISTTSAEEPAGQPNNRATTGTVDEPFIYDNPSKDTRHDSSTYAGFDLKLDPPHDGQSHESLSSSLPKLTLGGPFDDETFLPGQATTSNEPTLPHVVLPGDQHETPYGNELYPEDAGDEDRGRGMHRRQSSEYPQDSNIAARQSALGLPQSDSRRLSIGVRPLPPDELIESEDPETRANRIRSFYKEYFDDSKPDMAEYNQHYPPQGLPTEYHKAGGQAGGQYYEDYDQSYLNGEAGAYFDPQSNTFVMPYAQPVQRRAMTPPPSGSRFPGGGRPRGPNGGPRNLHGSMGAPMPRSGSAMSAGMRPGSSVSNLPGGRSASNMSGRIGAPRKALPPPEALNTLPTPSKLKDDSFALLGAIEFAPPPTLKDHVAGRSQSPLGERRAYQMMPAGSPLVSAFEEMPALPSPHLLRKSNTFTALDFAPPRKFKDADTMSDAGSIRSNRSGISAVQQAAIRSGAGRVSRLPGDQVFTTAALAETLKPNWGMRP